MRPCPRQSGQRSLIIWPAPWHAGHVRVIVKNPCWYASWPRPPQVWQALAPVPAFAPASSPKLVAAAMVVNASGDGGTVAAPIVRQILATGLGA